MKKISFGKLIFGLFILSMFSFASCKKDKDNPSSSDYYVKFKLDGADKQYTAVTAAVFTTALPLYSVAMVGEQQNGTVYEGMGINIYNDAAITANVTYTDAEVATVGTSQAVLLYTDANGAQKSSASTTSSPNVKVTITQLDDKSVTGTFSGTIANTTDFSSPQTVTEGQFHLPRH